MFHVTRRASELLHQSSQSRPTFPGEKYPEILESLVAKLAALLVSEGLDAVYAGRIAFAQAERMRAQFGGQKVYFALHGRSASARMLSALATRLVRPLIDGGFSDARARRIADEHYQDIRRDLAGQRLYIPIGASFGREHKKRLVYEQWNGKNTRALCRQLGITDSYLRILFAEARAEAKCARRLRDAPHAGGPK